MKISTFFRIGLIFGALYTVVKALDSQRQPKSRNFEAEPDREYDIVEEAMLDSVPASDPTAYR